MNILVFAAHPDDDILGTGGTIAKLSKEGHNCYAVICSNGESLLGTHIFKKTVAIETRISEATKAGEIIGFKKTMFLGLKDTKLNEAMRDKDVYDRIKRIIKSYNPDRIFTHSVDDAHPDHSAVARATLEICEQIKYEKPIYSYEIWNPVDIKKRSLPKMYVDISSTFRQKMKAFRTHESQFFQTLPVIPSIYIKSIIAGFKVKGRYAEEFSKVQ